MWRAPAGGVQSPAAARVSSTMVMASGRSRADGETASSTGSPSRMRRSGTSIFLPLMVRGSAGTASTRSGTWRGDNCWRRRRGPPFRSAAARSLAVLSRGGRRAQRPGRPAGRAPPRARARWCRPPDTPPRLDIVDHPVELGCPHAHATPVEGGVRASVDNAAPLVRELHPVAMPPHSVVGGEVALVEPAAVVNPEAERHRRHRLGHHQLAHRADHRPARVVVRLDLGAQSGALQLSRPAAAQAKPSADSGEPVEPKVRTDMGAATVRGDRPARRQVSTKAALVPKNLTDSSPASRHSAPRSGWRGLPS
jgi:hypothetical protein